MTKEKIISRLKAWGILIKNKAKAVYNIVSIISTLSILGCVLFWIISLFIHSNQSDNDIIMNQIREELFEGEEINSLYTEDLHGFGNNSIIATTFSDETWNNRLLILDIVDNQFLQHLNDPFGLKTHYKVTLSYTLLTDGNHFYPQIETIGNLFGGTASEIAARFNVVGSTYGAYVNGIFQYSYEDSKYHLVGTYPLVEKVDLSSQNPYLMGPIFGTDFYENDDSGSDLLRCYDSDGEYMLTVNCFWKESFWVYDIYDRYYLVTPNYDRYEDEIFVNVYSPWENTDNLKKYINWELEFSEDMEGYIWSETNNRDIVNFINQHNNSNLPYIYIADKLQI